MWRINKYNRVVVIGGALTYIYCTPIRSDIIQQFSVKSYYLVLEKCTRTISKSIRQTLISSYRKEYWVQSTEDILKSYCKQRSLESAS